MLRITVILASLVVVANQSLFAGPGLFTRKPKVDEAKARVLIETLKSDADEKKRKTAADELGGADPRAVPEIVPALVTALRKDTSASVRTEAADSLRQLGVIFPQAGAALEDVAEMDSSPLVRLAAKRALWEYHLNGYRSAKGADGLLAQTIEPPIASPSDPRPANAMIPAPPVPTLTPQVPPVPASPVANLPQVTMQPAPQPGPRLWWPNVLPGPRTAIRNAISPSSPPILNVTGEPPIAKKPATVAVPVVRPDSPEPPLRLPTQPDFKSTLPPFVPTLPSVVTPPNATPLPLPIPKLNPAPGQP